MITHTCFGPGTECCVYSYHSVLTSHEPELLFTHPPRLPGDVNRIFRSRTGRHRCTPDRSTDLFTRFVTVSTASTPSHRCNCHNPDGSLASRPLMDPPHNISGNPGTISVPLGRKTEPTQAKQSTSS
jgi:hypothetical protein